MASSSTIDFVHSKLCASNGARPYGYRLRGRGREPQATAALSSLVAAGQAEELNGWLKLTRAGRAALAERLTTERAYVDRAAVTAAYADFDRHNSAFKRLVTDWQLKDGATPNDHTDARYDAKIAERLGELHVGFLPLLERLVLLAPRPSLTAPSVELSW